MMERAPHLPIILKSMKRVEPRDIKLRTTTGPNPNGDKPSCRSQEDQAVQEKSDEAEAPEGECYPIIDQAAEFQITVQCRRAAVRSRLCAVFRKFRCNVFDWEALRQEVMETDAYARSPYPLSRTRRREKGRSQYEWKSLALDLLVVTGHFRLEDPAVSPGYPTSDLQFEIFLRMISALNSDPETGKLGAPSVREAS